MINIIIANISITSNTNNINPQLKRDAIITITDKYITIGEYSLIKNSLAIKDPIFITKNNSLIVIKDKKKNIIYNIDIHKIYNRMDYSDHLSKNNLKKENINLVNSEKDMKIDIINNFSEYFKNAKIIKSEYTTPYGNIDILAINNKGEYLIIELKKRSTDLNTINQVVKYGEYFDENNKIFNLYVIGIKNNGKNKEYALKKNVEIINYVLK